MSSEWSSLELHGRGREERSGNRFQWMLTRPWEAVLILMLASLPGLLVHLQASPPPWFDEGLNTNTALTLAQRGVYGTESSEGLNPFDVAITSGPPLVAPIAIVFRLFGPSMFGARIVSVGYAILALWMVLRLMPKIFGVWAGWLSVFSLLVMPTVGGISFTLMARQAMGETASLGLFLSGLWVWRAAMEHPSRTRSLGAGILFGLSVMAKMQSGLPILTTMGLMVVLRAWRRPGRAWISEAVPLLAAVFVIVGWLGLSWWGTPGAERAVHADLQWKAIRILIIPGPLGRPMTRGLWAIFLFMLGAVALLWSGVASAIKRLGELTPEESLKCGLFLVILLDAIWFAGLSIGWPRYAYLGFMLAVIVWASSLAGLLGRTMSTLARNRQTTLSGMTSVSIILMALAIGSSNFVSGLRGPSIDPGRQMADFIDSVVPPTSVIEGWEWQVDALSQHRAFSHPDQAMMLTAISQYHSGARTFDIGYPLIEKTPGYLLLGPFGEWTKVYQYWLDSGRYVELAKFGAYTLYRDRSS